MLGLIIWILHRLLCRGKFLVQYLYKLEHVEVLGQILKESLRVLKTYLVNRMAHIEVIFQKVYKKVYYWK